MLKYKLLPDDTVGVMYDDVYVDNLEGVIDIPTYTTDLDEKKRLVTQILDNAFIECCKIRVVTLPSSIRHIGKRAFAKCNRLDVINMENGILTIGENAFALCNYLEKCELPDTITEIGIGAFANCENLLSIHIPELLDEIKENTFNECCSLKEVIIGDNVKTLRMACFAKCHDLERVMLGKSLHVIEEGAFFQCVNLESVLFNDCLVELGNKCFHKCRLLNVSIPSSVKSIGERCFSECAILESFVIEYPSDSEDNRSSLLLGKATFAGCFKLSHVYLGYAVKMLPDYMFVAANISDIHSLLLFVSEIGEGAFVNNKTIGTLHIPDNITTIQKNAFQSCEYLTKLIIGNGL